MRGTLQMARTFGLAVLAAGLLAASPLASPASPAQPAKPAKPQAKAGELPLVRFDAEKKQVRVECEALRVEGPLEFFLCRAMTAEHEAVLRSKALPSHVHFEMLAIGLKPGAPLTFIEETE